MNEKYITLDNGVIKQVDYNKINYNSKYNEKYNQYGEKGIALSNLRLGVLLGTLGYIPNRILDVGYGNCDFLKAAKNIIKECHGADISEYPVPGGCVKVDSLYTHTYDVVCFFDSLEHFDDIYEIKNLKTDYVFISVPWCHNISEEWFANWYHRRPNEHLWHFNLESLTKFFKELGYTRIYTSNFEDAIRKNAAVAPLNNILSCMFKKA